MSCFRMILLVALVTVASALVVERRNVELPPVMPAKEFEKLENAWAAQAEAFTLCLNPKDLSKEYWKCEGSRKAFVGSCGMIASNTIKLSSKDNVVEYMKQVCTNLKVGWHQATCQKAGTLIAAAMTANAYENHKFADERGKKACHGLWEYSVAEQEAKAKALRRSWNAPSMAAVKAKEEARWQRAKEEARWQRKFGLSKAHWEVKAKAEKEEEVKKKKILKTAKEEVAWRALGVLPSTEKQSAQWLEEKEANKDKAAAKAAAYKKQAEAKKMKAAAAAAKQATEAKAVEQATEQSTEAVAAAKQAARIAKQANEALAAAEQKAAISAAAAKAAAAAKVDLQKKHAQARAQARAQGPARDAGRQQASLVQQSLQRENQRVTIMTTDEAHANSLRHLDEYDAHQKQIQDWASSQNVAINHRNAMILRIQADQERRKANLDIGLD